LTNPSFYQSTTASRLSASEIDCNQASFGFGISSVVAWAHKLGTSEFPSNMGLLSIYATKPLNTGFLS
ncbi:hypothetical protein, partial [Methylomonas methanica]|uniref:hypothetical protein n=1 Tax=Methylomonas methanica TaxID=421 RepID=UPI003B0115A4